MSMYLPNPAVRPDESEAVEFIDASLVALVRQGEVGSSVERDHDRMPLSPQTKSDITRWVRAYVTDLVLSRGGNRDDVRSIVHDLDHQLALADDREDR
jgi:hypothetical protein